MASSGNIFFSIAKSRNPRLSARILSSTVAVPCSNSRKTSLNYYFNHSMSCTLRHKLARCEWKHYWRGARPRGLSRGRVCAGAKQRTARVLLACRKVHPEICTRGRGFSGGQQERWWWCWAHQRMSAMKAAFRYLSRNFHSTKLVSDTFQDNRKTYCENVDTLHETVPGTANSTWYFSS